MEIEDRKLSPAKVESHVPRVGLRVDSCVSSQGWVKVQGSSLEPRSNHELG